MGSRWHLGLESPEGSVGPVVQDGSLMWLAVVCWELSWAYWPEHPHVASPCGLGFSQHGGHIPRWSISRANDPGSRKVLRFKSCAWSWDSTTSSLLFIKPVLGPAQIWRGWWEARSRCRRKVEGQMFLQLSLENAVCPNACYFTFFFANNKLNKI